jgi:hypothetical protein
MQPECSITLEPIKVYGITCVGQLYEYEAIVEWLKENDCDPLTNVFVPTRNVIRFEGSHVEALERAKEFKKLTLLWCPSFEFQLGESLRIQFQKLLALKSDEQVKIREYFEQFDFLAYGSEKANRAFNSRKDHWPKTRPFDTGCGLQFLYLKEKVIEGICFKSEKFDFAVLENCTFIWCSFGSASFIGTQFNNCTFINCTLAFGGWSFFYKAQGTIIIREKIHAEFFDRKIPTNNQQIENIFQQRLFQGRVIFLP